MATVVLDDLWFCDDCTMVAANGDLTGLDAYDDADERAAEIAAGLAALVEGVNGGYVVTNFTDDDGVDEFSRSDCDCCGSTLGGRRTRFAVLES